MERLRGRGRQEQDRCGAGERPRAARFHDLPGSDSDLLRPLDLQDRRSSAAGRGRNTAGPHDRKRHLSLDHGPVGLDRPAGAYRAATDVTVGGRMAQHRGGIPALSGRRTRPGTAHGPGGNPAVPCRAARAAGRRQRSQRNHPVGDQQRARPMARQGGFGRRGRADRRPLRPLRDRHSHRWRLDLQRCRGQRVRDRSGPGGSGGVRQKRSPNRPLPDFRGLHRGRSGPAGLAGACGPAHDPAQQDGSHPQSGRDEPVWPNPGCVRPRPRPVLSGTGIQPGGSGGGASGQHQQGRSAPRLLFPFRPFSLCSRWRPRHLHREWGTVHREARELRPRQEERVHGQAVPSAQR